MALISLSSWPIHDTSRHQVAQKFAIGSKGTYTYGPHGAGAGSRSHLPPPLPPPQQQSWGGALCLSTTYPPGDGLIDEMGDNLLELGFLGRGAGSVEVVKALHFPSMRMVAVKKVPIDDPAKLAQAIHELDQLLTNQVRCDAMRCDKWHGNAMRAYLYPTNENGRSRSGSASQTTPRAWTRIATGGPAGSGVRVCVCVCVCVT